MPEQRLTWAWSERDRFCPCCGFEEHYEEGIEYACLFSKSSASYYHSSYRNTEHVTA